MMKGHVLVTGVCGGIGRAIAAHFKLQGYEVFGIDQTPRPADLPVDGYSELDLEEFVVAPTVARQLALQLDAWLGDGGLSVLVNNAAVQICGSLEDLDLASWNRSLSVNLLAPFFLVKASLARLERSRGCVINVSSIHARLTKPGFTVYATTKAALSGLSRAMAVELGSRVRVNAIEPAAIDTEMLRAAFEGRRDEYAGLAACHPQGRLGSAEELASLVYSVAVGEFRFLHGACIDFSGGISARLHDPI
jgi:NAD(P)-dependent dehydrogenase (short-subunit alcohol dehydrogenase family)